MASKARELHRILLNVGIVVVFLSMLVMGALPKLMGTISGLLPAGMMSTDPRAMFPEVFGLPLWFATVTGVLELLAAILVLLPRIRPWGGLLTGCIMLGAMAFNLRAGEIRFVAINIIILAAAGLVVWYNPYDLFPGRRRREDET